MLRRERVAYMGYGGLLMLGYQKSSAAAPHARNASGSRGSQTSEAMSDADFGEGLGAGDDFWYSSMRSLPLAPPRSELRKNRAQYHP